jgi:hypothetical protein
MKRRKFVNSPSLWVCNRTGSRERSWPQKRCHLSESAERRFVSSIVVRGLRPVLYTLYFKVLSIESDAAGITLSARGLTSLQVLTSSISSRIIETLLLRRRRRLLQFTMYYSPSLLFTMGLFTRRNVRNATCRLQRRPVWGNVRQPRGSTKLR